MLSKDMNHGCILAVEGNVGTWLIMHVSISSWLKALPPLTLSMCLKYISLKEFSMEHDPHIIGVT